MSSNSSHVTFVFVQILKERFSYNIFRTVVRLFIVRRCTSIHELSKESETIGSET